MECPVCYSADATLKINCGHSFCRSCMKQWLESSKEEGRPGCPMCRTPVLFRGLPKIEDAIANTRYDNQCQEVYEGAFDAICESLRAHNEMWGEDFAPFFNKAAMLSLTNMENTYLFLRDVDGEPPSVIEDVLYDQIVVNVKKENRRYNQWNWQGRDKFKTKIQRRAPHMSIRR